MSWTPHMPQVSPVSREERARNVPFSQILEALAQRVGAARLALFEVAIGDEQSPFRLCAVWPTPGEEDVRETSLSLEFIGRHLAILSRGEAVGVPVTPRTDPDATGETLRVRLLLPLQIDDVLRGLLQVDHALVAHAWSPSEVALLRGAAAVLALVLRPASMLPSPAVAPPHTPLVRSPGVGVASTLSAPLARSGSTEIARSSGSRALRESGALLGPMLIELRNTRAALARAEERVREQGSLLDQASDVIMVRDLSGRVLFWNKGAERLLGWTASEAVGRNVLDLFATSGDALMQTASSADPAEQPGIHECRSATEETWLTTREGRQIACETRRTLLRDGQGQPRAVLVVGRDLTERKQLEERFLRSQRLEVLGKLAGGMAHDLNNMLTPIRLGIDLLQTGTPAQDSAGLLAVIRASVDHGVALIEQILTFARGMGPASGPCGPHEGLHLTTVLDRVTRMLRHTLPRSITLEHECPPNLWTVRGNPTQLVQLLVNLCVNARDAMPSGGTLRLSAANVILRREGGEVRLPGLLGLAGFRQLGDARPGPHVVLKVRDGGDGMSLDLLQTIFAPFVSTKAAGKGTGLGLSSVLAIARGHGGILAVESEPGRGTEFSLFLPVTDAEIHSEQEEDYSAQPGQGEVILLVDDEASIRDAVRVTLEAFGYRVLCAAGGSEAITLYGERHAGIDVVLVDLLMPGVDGLATIRTLRGLNAEIRIILASGTLPPGLAEAPELQNVTFLHKPYRAHRLLAVLRTVLSSASPEQSGA